MREIDLRRKLVLAIEVLGREFKIEYEGLHLICFGCGRYGHRREECPDGGVTNAKMQPQAATTKTIPMVKANGEGLDAANLAPDNLEVFPEESGIVTEVQAKSTGRIDDNVGNQTTSFGPWMLVSKNQCKGARPKQGSGPGPKVQVQLDSRFNLLGNEEPKDQITPDLGNIASTHTPKHFEGKEEKLKLSSQEGRSKKTQTGKTPSILKSNVFAVQSKEVSKMQMERKEAGRQSFEAVVNKGKEVDSSPSPATKNRNEDD
ncbi:uncharacterized protein LOC110262665 [Arachis ipaensis]|uniref:uncharacterized protein LOC110262665 n=1 Tax=Arachis ipaensis TaxID=130454 RepID=UPI000A2B897C|nr:uncharacterized protein LOC110262665 [Arachis ipaensis]QHO14150.1 uncharacterized protein DS421_15g521710 [Arachis hypogaea]